MDGGGGLLRWSGGYRRGALVLGGVYIGTWMKLSGEFLLDAVEARGEEVLVGI